MHPIAARVADTLRHAEEHDDFNEGVGQLWFLLEYNELVERGESREQIIDEKGALVDSLAFATVISLADEEALLQRIAAMPQHVQQRVADSAVLQHTRSDRVLDLLVSWLHEWNDLPLLRRVLITLRARATYEWVHRVLEEHYRRLIDRVEELAGSPVRDLSEEAGETLRMLRLLEQLPPTFDLAYLQVLGRRRERVLEVIRLGLCGPLLQPVAEHERTDSIHATRLPNLAECYGRMPEVEAKRQHEQFERRMDKALREVVDPKERGRISHRMLVRSLREMRKEYSQWEGILNQQLGEWVQADGIAADQWVELQRHVVNHLHGAFRATMTPVIPRRFVPVVPYIAELLTHCAEARAAREDPPSFWEGVFAILKAGGLPIGWHGDYPQGKFVAFWG